MATFMGIQPPASVRTSTPITPAPPGRTGRTVDRAARPWCAAPVTAGPPELLRRIKALGLVATVTPGFMYMAETRFNLQSLGARGTPIRQLLDAGVPVALSTDGVPHSMLFALVRTPPARGTARTPTLARRQGAGCDVVRTAPDGVR